MLLRIIQYFCAGWPDPIFQASRVMQYLRLILFKVFSSHVALIHTSDVC